MKFRDGPAAIIFKHSTENISAINWYITRHFNQLSSIGQDVVLKLSAFESALLTELLK